MKKLTIYIAASTLLLLTNSSQGQDICRNAAGQADMQIRQVYGYEIDKYLKLARAAEFKGFNPRGFPQADHNGQVQIIDLIAVATALAHQRDIALQSIFHSFTSCARGLRPYQDIVNAALFFQSNGLYSIIPPAARNIDVSRLLTGTPLGGPGALIPNTRDNILRELQIGGDVARVIRNPRCIFGC